MIHLKALFLIHSLLAFSHLTTSTDHIVGGQDNGWDIGIDLLSWAQGQQFNVGDTLTFKYQVYHDVLEVSEQNYETCTTTNAFTRYTGDSTTIELNAPGSRYFICGVPRHCISGMKLDVNILPSASSPPPPSPSSPTNDSPPPPPPSPTYYSSPPLPTPTPDYSSPAPPIFSSPPPPYTTYASQPPQSPQMPTPTYTTTPPAIAASPTTTECDSPPKPFMAPALTPKHHKHKKPHHKPGKAPRHAHAPKKAPAPAPNVYEQSRNYLSQQGSELSTSAAPAKIRLLNFGVSSVLTVFMLWIL